MIDFINSEIKESIRIKEKFLAQNDLIKLLEELINLCVKVIENNNKIIFCGNGGSFADAQHLTAEFLIRLTSEVNREGIPAISLVQDSSTFAVIEYVEAKLLKEKFLNLS